MTHYVPRRRAAVAMIVGTVLIGSLALSSCAQTIGTVTFDSAAPNPTVSPSATATVDPSATPTVEPSALPGTGDLASFYSQTLAWKACGGEFQCSVLTVPIDYAVPSSGSTQVSVIRLRSTDPSQRVGSLVLNPGGPGGSGVDYVRAARAVIDDAVRQKFTIVGFDPRGVASSDPIACIDDKQTDTFVAADGTPDTPTEIGLVETLAKQFADSCKANSPKLYGHVDTRSVARDMDVLRAALGDEKLNYFGASYGTYLGATYADLFPSRVGRMVLDGAIDPTLSNVELTRTQGQGFEIAFDRFAQDCSKQPDCPLPTGKQRAIDAMVKFFAKLDRTPLPTNDGQRPLTEALAENAVLSYLYVPPSDWDRLRAGLAAAFAGDGSELLGMLDERIARDGSGHYVDNSTAALYAVNALDRPDRPTTAQWQVLADQWAVTEPIFGRFFAWGSLPFSYWGVPATNTPHAISAPGSGPILVVGTTYDPATPYPWAQALAKQLSRGVLLTRVGDGHTAYGMGSACIDQGIDQYLVTGVTPPVDTVCR